MRIQIQRGKKSKTMNKSLKIVILFTIFVIIPIIFILNILFGLFILGELILLGIGGTVSFLVIGLDDRSQLLERRYRIYLIASLIAIILANLQPVDITITPRLKFNLLPHIISNKT